MTITKSQSSWSVYSMTTRNQRVKHRRRHSDASASSWHAPSEDIDESDIVGDVNARDSRGKSLLYYAARYDQIDIAKCLLDAGCDPNITDQEGNTALHEAVEKTNLEMVQLLTSKSCDANIQNQRGLTPLMRAMYFDFFEGVKALHKAGASLNEVDTRGRSALLIGLEEGSEWSCVYLLRHGCDVNIIDKEGTSALYLATHTSCTRTLEFAKKLLKSGYKLTKDATWLTREATPDTFDGDKKFYSRLVNKLASSTNTTSTRKSSSTFNKVDLFVVKLKKWLQK